MSKDMAAVFDLELNEHGIHHAHDLCHHDDFEEDDDIIMDQEVLLILQYFIDY